MYKLDNKTIKKVANAIVYIVFGGFSFSVLLTIYYLDSRPDLNLWHEAQLSEEFTKDSAITTFGDYLSLEDRLFDQLEQRVYQLIDQEDKRETNRYHHGSLSDPTRWKPNWNRTFELTTENPQAGVLLLHGMSDSPYSLRTIGVKLNQEGAWVLGLRLPGHGTTPSALVETEWEDMAAAVDIAISHLHNKIGDHSLYIVGYSNGGALGIQYILRSLEDKKLPRIDKLVLISPAIGVSPLAVLAIWQSRLGHVTGLSKLEWNTIQPEYDPFKYRSFAVNAGNQVYRLTSDIASRLDKLQSSGALVNFPPSVTFQSVADATVSTSALIDQYLAKLPQDKHELVLFDINRKSESQYLINQQSLQVADTLINGAASNFEISLISNESTNSNKVVLEKRVANASEVTFHPLSLSWPNGTYSLSHVALSFPPEDPLYGGPEADVSPGIKLGNVSLRGERGILQVPASDILLQRWNPFYPYLELRITRFLAVDTAENP